MEVLVMMVMLLLLLTIMPLHLSNLQHAFPH